MRETSLLAYQQIKANGVLSKRRFQAYEVLYRSEWPMTASEVADAAHVPGLWKRMSELRRIGVAREAGGRVCKVTGHTATLWELTDYVPTEEDIEAAIRKPEEKIP